MFSKQDVVKPRTAEDLERRYKFGKSFAETNGLIAENAKTISESNKAMAQIKRSVSDQDAAIASLTTWKDTATTSIASIEAKAAANEASITSLTTWKDETVESVASIDQRVTDAEATIELLTKLGDGDESSLAELVTKVNANEASITSLTEWKGGVDEDLESIASIEEKATANEASIKTLTEWKDTTTTSIASIEQTVSDQGAEIALKASKTEVTEQLGGYYTKTETDAALVLRDDAINLKATKTEVDSAKDAAIESANASTDEKLKSYSTTEEMEAAIELSADGITSTVKSTYATKDELSGTQTAIQSTIAEVKQTADESHAGIELLVEYDSNGNPTASGSLVIKAINGESTAKINADRLDIEGKELNIKVPSTNVLGTLSADRIHSGTIRSNDHESTDTICVWSDGLLTEWLTGVGTATENLELSEDGKALIELDFDGDVLVIPEGVEEIATQCVGNFSTLVLPESLTTIKSDTFVDCDYLRNVVLKGPTIVDHAAFSGCGSLENIFYVYVFEVMPDCFDPCNHYSYSEKRPGGNGYYWRYKPIGLSIDLDSGTLLSPLMTLGDKLQFKGNNHEMTIADDGVHVEYMETATPETIKISHDSVVSERDSKKRFSASQAGFTTGLPSYNNYSNMPTSFHGVQNTNGDDLIGMRIGTTTALIGSEYQVVPKLELLVGGTVYMTFSNNKITTADGILGGSSGDDTDVNALVQQVIAALPKYNGEVTTV